MRKILLAAMIAIMMLSLIIPISDDSNAANTVSFDGYILIDGKKGVSNEYIEVKIYSQLPDGSYNIEKAKGIVDGYFKVGDVPSSLPATSYYLNIELNGFELSTLPEYFDPKLVEIGVDDVKCAHLVSLPTLANNTYRVSTDDMHAISITSATGTISGNVTADNSAMTALNGVKISILDPIKKIIVASCVSSNGGSYVINNCPVGKYTITAETSDYETMVDNIDVTTGTNVVNIVLTSSPGQWFGMDLSHVLMVIAGIIGTLLIIAAITVRVKMKGKKPDIVYDDSEE